MSNLKGSSTSALALNFVFGLCSLWHLTSPISPRIGNDTYSPPYVELNGDCDDGSAPHLASLFRSPPPSLRLPACNHQALPHLVRHFKSRWLRGEGLVEAAMAATATMTMVNYGSRRRLHSGSGFMMAVASRRAANSQ